MKAIRLVVVPDGCKVWRVDALPFNQVRWYPARQEGPSIVTRMMLARRANRMKTGYNNKVRGKEKGYVHQG